MPAADDDAAAKELDEMKKRLKEMEEAAALREMQAKVEKEMGAVQDPASAAAAQASKEEVDSRSVFVGNVDYACTPEEVQQHFQACGTVNRVTILTDKFGQPKGFAYVEFLEQEAVQEALQLNESELHGRQLKVMVKRTNVPGMKQYRPRRFNPYLAYGYRRPYVPHISILPMVMARSRGSGVQIATCLIIEIPAAIQLVQMHPKVEIHLSHFYRRMRLVPHDLYNL
ncbi:UNVERIFIED_CONTAM: Polyadenylate-binding protein 2 [Sesamum latifolium]|uniref:Polyadenylate-binding protein 2 n=1 Tax=Sesamum latifolium TaxID=2727402 RepID=A0AAW2Y6K8_9LAMI